MSLLILNAAKILHTLPGEKLSSFDPTTGLEYSYNFLNLPCSVYDGEEMQLQYTYFADGTKYMVMDNDYDKYLYVGPFVYRVRDDGNPFLESVSSEEGRLVYDESSRTWRDCWFTKDHIGNVRTVLDLSKSASAPLSDIIVEQDSYLPFGTKSANPALFGSDNRYRLCGKEDQRLDNFTTTLTDFGARSYNPTICRWMTIDPMAEKYHSTSPYNYCGNNPVVLVDPEGETPRVYVQKKKFGHVFVSVYEKEKTTIYSYGRYGTLYKFLGRTWGKYNPTGEGVITKYTGKNAAKHLDEVITEGDFDVFEINNASDEDTSNYFDSRMTNGTRPTDPSKNSYINPNSKVIDDYNILTNNCALMTEEGINRNGNYIPHEIIPVILSNRLKMKAQRDQLLHFIFGRKIDIIHVEDPENFVRQLQNNLKNEHKSHK